MMMNRKSLEKILGSMGYALRKTSNNEARWMVISNVLNYHWDFKDLNGVARFIADEKAMCRSARQYATLRK